MKKTLIALAAVAATGAAMAQSSVTLSGVIDVGFEKRFSGDPFKMTPNRNGTSNWTLSGSEDLGGGLKANFQISTSFNADDGSIAAHTINDGLPSPAVTCPSTTSRCNNTSSLGNNGMFVGLSGGFGTVRMGRPVNTLYGNALFANGTKGVSNYDANTLLARDIAGAANTVYVNNAIQYHSPRFSGVQVQLEYAPKESTSGKNGRGLAIRYDEGPISVTFTNYLGATSSTTQKSVNQLAAAYDFGVARVLFTWRDQGGAASNADNSYALGMTAPVGPGLVYVSYNVRELAATDARSVIAGYKYNLSKRTQMYVNVANGNSALNVPGTTPAKSSTGYGFGLQHNF
ncbi:Outer membrane porin protein 32 [Tepidimonas sediminis]|uniref:Outer membrane porin protein 32 n=1 Tax=Tepidimonas sediminis TaxID=2588941 RepID=A0A554WLE9_9BURK|nr:porin [Tepidimonas sediminis]TSE24376.1 Outer membrane porin protein 32 [Tepidimonas sediminis]